MDFREALVLAWRIGSEAFKAHREGAEKEELERIHALVEETKERAKALRRGGR